MKIVPQMIFGLLLLAVSGLAEEKEGSPSTNRKDRGALEAYNQALREQGGDG